jgi:hypothetical protein
MHTIRCLDEKHPTLSKLLVAGTITIDKGEYIGKASDGVTVSIGTCGYEDAAERYLAARPTPDLW